LVWIQIRGRPTQRTSRRPSPRTSDIWIRPVSAIALLSPLVTSFFGPSNLMTRWVTISPRLLGELKTITRPSTTERSWTGLASTTSPMLIRGSIDPLSTTYGRQPNRIGTSVIARQPAMNHSQLRPTSPAYSRRRP